MARADKRARFTSAARNRASKDRTTWAWSSSIFAFAAASLFAFAAAYKKCSTLLPDALTPPRERCLLKVEEKEVAK